MSRRPLAPLFATLLASLTEPACRSECYCCIPDEVKIVLFPTEDLAPFLADGMLDVDECVLLCNGPTALDEPTGGGSTSGTTGDSTSGGSTDGSPTSSPGPLPTTDDGDDSGGDAPTGCSAEAIDAAMSKLSCSYPSGVACGRRPIGRVSARSTRARDPGLAWLLTAAELEQISVPAFDELAAELAHHGAPDELRVAALRAADDERRHAATISALVRRRGREPGAPRIEPSRTSDLEALARQNTIEGCVRETWGALLAAFQARNAVAMDVRAAQAGIADDERSHAELAWQIDAWTRTQLSAEAQARVDAARADAVGALAAELDRFGVGVPEVGLPNATQARALLHGLRAALW